MAHQTRVARQFEVDEQEFNKHLDFFIRITREKFPSGFTFLSGLQKSISKDKEEQYQVRFSEPMVFLLNYLGSEYKGKPERRNEVFARIIEHLITRGYN